VTQEIYAENYNKLVTAYWKAQEQIELDVDFGMVILSQKKFKQIVTKHFQTLIKDFKNHLNEEFEN